MATVKACEHTTEPVAASGDKAWGRTGQPVAASGCKAQVRSAKPVAAGGGKDCGLVNQSMASDEGKTQEQMAQPVAAGGGKTHGRAGQSVATAAGKTHGHTGQPVPSGTGNTHGQVAEPVASGTGKAQGYMGQPVATGTGKAQEHTAHPVAAGGGKAWECAGQPVAVVNGDGLRGGSEGGGLDSSGDSHTAKANRYHLTKASSKRLDRAGRERLARANRKHFAKANRGYTIGDAGFHMMGVDTHCWQVKNEGMMLLWGANEAVCAKVGVNAAIVFQHLWHQVYGWDYGPHNMRAGRVWLSYSAASLSRWLSFMSDDVVLSSLHTLVDAGLLLCQRGRCITDWAVVDAGFAAMGETPSVCHEGVPAAARTRAAAVALSLRSAARRGKGGTCSTGDVGRWRQEAFHTAHPPGMPAHFAAPLGGCSTRRCGARWLGGFGAHDEAQSTQGSEAAAATTQGGRARATWCTR